MGWAHEARATNHLTRTMRPSECAPSTVVVSPRLPHCREAPISESQRAPSGIARRRRYEGVGLRINRVLRRRPARRARNLGCVARARQIVGRVASGGPAAASLTTVVAGVVRAFGIRVAKAGDVHATHVCHVRRRGVHAVARPGSHGLVASFSDSTLPMKVVDEAANDIDAAVVLRGVSALGEARLNAARVLYDFNAVHDGTVSTAAIAATAPDATAPCRARSRGSRGLRLPSPRRYPR